MSSYLVNKYNFKSIQYFPVSNAIMFLCAWLVMEIAKGFFHCFTSPKYQWNSLKSTFTSVQPNVCLMNQIDRLVYYYRQAIRWQTKWMHPIAFGNLMIIENRFSLIFAVNLVFIHVRCAYKEASQRYYVLILEQIIGKIITYHWLVWYLCIFIPK